MAKNNDRVLVLDDALLFSLVNEKAALVESGRATSKQMDDLQKQYETLNNSLTDLMAKANSKKIDILKRVEKLAKKQLTEFEIPVTTEIRDGKVVLIITDAMAEFTASFKAFDKWKEPVPKKEKTT